MGGRKELWMAKTDRAHPQVKLRGLNKVDRPFVFSCAAHNSGAKNPHTKSPHNP